MFLGCCHLSFTDRSLWVFPGRGAMTFCYRKMLIANPHTNVISEFLNCCIFLSSPSLFLELEVV